MKSKKKEIYDMLGQRWKKNATWHIQNRQF
jgi:hypothetical protein